MRTMSSGDGSTIVRSTTSRTSASATPSGEITSASRAMRCAKPSASAANGIERRRAAAAADQHDRRAIELVVGDQLVDRAAQLRGREFEDRRARAPRRASPSASPTRAKASSAASPSPRANAPSGTQPEHVRGAGRRDRDARPSRVDERGDARRRSATRARAIVAGVAERRVRAAGDVRASAGRPRATRAAFDDTRATPPRDAERAHVERAQHRAMAADARRAHLRTAAPDHRTIGARAADFDEDAVGDVLVEQRAGDPGGRPREHRQDRTPLDLARRPSRRRRSA